LRGKDFFGTAERPDFAADKTVRAPALLAVCGLRRALPPVIMAAMTVDQREAISGLRMDRALELSGGNLLDARQQRDHCFEALEQSALVRQSFLVVAGGL
jgi:hypothetical protein